LLAIAAVVALGLSAPVLKRLATEVRADTSHRFGIGNGRLAALARQESAEYTLVSGEVQDLGPLPGPRDPILVIGDPIYYLLLHRTQAVELNGWSAEQQLPVEWRESTREIERSRPQWVFIGLGNLNLVRAHAPAILTFLGANYRVYRSTSATYESGTWWVTDRPGRPERGGIHL
jgi:hypothetical protein